MQCANWEGDVDPLALELIPDIGAHRIVGLVDSRVIAHVKIDLVNHSEIGKIDEKNFYRRIRQNVARALCSAPQPVFHAIGLILIFNSYANAHRVDFGRIVQIDDLVANHLVVWDVEINVVIRTEPSGTPVDLAHFGVGVAYLQPIPDLIGPINLDRYAADNPGKEILSSEAKDDCDNARAGQQSFEVRLGMVAVTQDKQQYNQENDPAGNLTEKMRYRRLSFLFEIKIPNGTINQRDNQRRAQQNYSCTDMISPGCVDTVNANGR